MLFSNRVRATIADVADGADGIFQRRAYPDYSASGAAFTTKGNVDAEHPKKCLCPAQMPSESAGVFGPAGAVACLTGAFNADPQKIGGAPRPGAGLAHELPHASGDRVVTALY
jgi:hypothetical protein